MPDGSSIKRPIREPSIVLFDHGGTLSKTTKEHTEIVLDVLTEYGCRFTKEQVNDAFQISEKWWNENQHRLPRGQRRSLLVESNSILLRELGVKDVALLAEKIQSEWHARAGFTLYPDTIPCLNELKRRGMPMGIVSQNTDTNEEFRNLALRVEGIEHYFSVIVTSESAGHDKPDPRLFLAAADAAGVVPQQALFVGDKLDMDVNGAAAAGMQAVLIDRLEIMNRNEIPVIASLLELPKLLV